MRHDLRQFRSAILLILAVLLGWGADRLSAQVSLSPSRQTAAFLRITGGSAALAVEGLFAPASGRLAFSTGSAAQWEIDQSGDFVASTDNADDIGNVAGLRPRTGYFGTAVAAGDTTASAGTFRLPNTGSLQLRNAANDGNLIALQGDAANTIILASGSQLTLTTTPGVNVPANSGWRLVCVSSTTGKIFFAKTVDAFGCQP